MARRRYTSVARARRRRTAGWVRLSDARLLDLRLCDLDLRLEGTWLEEMVERLHAELERHDIRIRPHCWLSNEWFSPDGVPGIAIPFYLAHPRLMKLEQRQMLEVEGGTRQACMRILRHEAGHCIDTAFRLRRKRSWQRVFGRASRRYPDSYHPRPYSRHYVLHLDWWYAQSHPVEDFSETFAVWLKPWSHWRRTYDGWPALRKLDYVDELMMSLAGKRPPVRSRRRIDPISGFKKTLREHYEQKREHYGFDLPDLYRQDLEKLFTTTGRRAKAAAFLRRVKTELREQVALWTGQHPYTIEQFLKEMITSCRVLDLRLMRAEQQTKLDVAVLLTVYVMDYLHEGGKRVAL